jgi:pimeloyl-ACP methyl ester carboxylesterase
VKRPLSQLIYARVQEGTGTPRIITLHDYNQHARDVSAYGLAAGSDARIIGLESYKGVFVGHTIVGYTWFVGPNDRPSPLFFGDALAEIERFLWDEIDRQETDQPGLPYLIGVGQGAIMALAAAAAVPDLLSGVIALDGFLPIVPGWEPPLVPLDGLPLLVLESGNANAPASDGVLAGERLESTYRAWGAAVTRLPIASGEISGAPMSSWLRQQSPRSRRLTPAT